VTETAKPPRHLRPSRIGLPRPTGAAWALALLGLALLGAAINTGNNLLYLLFGLLSAALPVSLGLSLFNLVRLRATLQVAGTVQAGVPYTVTVHLRNLGRRPARGVRVRVFTRRGVLGPALVETVPGGAQVAVTLTGCETVRGPLRIMGVRLGSVVPLGLVERRRFYPAPATPLVLPAAPACRLPRQAGGDPLGEVPVPSGRDGGEYDGLRRGREEDDVRRVDWKSTARRGVLLVRETSGEARPCLAFDLKTRRQRDTQLARIAFEGEVSFHAGRARPVLEAGGEVQMTVDGADRRVFQGMAGLPALLRRLAVLEPTGPAGRPLPQALPAGERQKKVRAPLPDTPPAVALATSSVIAMGISATALFAYDGLGAVAFLSLLVGLLIALSRGSRIRSQGRWASRLWQVAGVAALLVFVADLLFVRHNPLNASLNLIAFIALYKIFNSRDARDDRQMILVSVLMIILAAALTTGVSFVLPLLAWLVVVTHAQVAWAHLPLDRGHPCRPARYAPAAGRLRYAGPTALTASALVAIGAILFTIIPHLGTGAFAPGALGGGTRSGFSETTRLGDIGRIKLDRSRVMQVTLPDAGASTIDLKWRGLALDRFDGQAWTRTATGLDWISADGDGWFRPRGEPESRGLTSSPVELVQEIRLDPSSQRVLFAASTPASIRSEEFLFLAEDGTGAVILPGRPGRGLSYTVVSQMPQRDARALRAASGGDPKRVRSLHLALPPLDGRVRDLARGIVADAPTRYDAALALESWLANNLEYSLDVTDAGRDDPLADFLLAGMPGHCEYFATSMVVMARSVGIPARFVAGYLRGERSRFAPLYTVRQSDAHSWVEVFFPGAGWVPFDPTPPAGRGNWQDGNWRSLAGDLTSTVARLWDDYVIGIDLDDQARGFMALRDALAAALTGSGDRLVEFGRGGARLAGWAAALILAVAAAVILRRLPGGGFGRRRPPGAEGSMPPFYGRLLRWLSRRGMARRPGETPAELADRAAATLPAAAAQRVRDLTDLYYRVRYDGGGGAPARRLARRLLADLRRGKPGHFPLTS
jgi:uncharacterized protein (DUF58 family)